MAGLIRRLMMLAFVFVAAMFLLSLFTGKKQDKDANVVLLDVNPARVYVAPTAVSIDSERISAAVSISITERAQSKRAVASVPTTSTPRR